MKEQRQESVWILTCLWSLRLKLKPGICAVTFFACVVDVTEFASDGVLSELLYADDLVLMSEIIE